MGNACGAQTSDKDDAMEEEVVASANPLKEERLQLESQTSNGPRVFAPDARHAAPEGDTATAAKPTEQREEERDAALKEKRLLSLSEARDELNKEEGERISQTVALERLRWQEESDMEARKTKREEYEKHLVETRNTMLNEDYNKAKPANRYGNGAHLPEFVEGSDIPVLALINPMSGGMAGSDILQVARGTPYYNQRFFDIIAVVKDSKRRGGFLDVFRLELCKAKDEAARLGTRPRIISGGGDGTGSFALFIIFSALRADPSREEDGLADSGNGFIWTDEEMKTSFPALAQMPLGSANDFGNILGWGQKYPGERSGPSYLCTSRGQAKVALQQWVSAIKDSKSRLANFDVWGIMPAKGAESVDFKIAELTGPRGFSPKKDGNLQLKPAGKPVPFLVCLYFSCGFGAYMTSRFQINRRRTPTKNRMEYVRQAVGIILERTPPQLHVRLDNVEIDCEGKEYFPPRREKGNRGKKYREVGFYNINWQAHALHGADRASLGSRLCSTRTPVQFGDGELDMFRWKFFSFIKNPGLRMQTDKKKDLTVNYNGGKGKGIFFQWDGEARFAFSPSGDPFGFEIKKVLNIPVVLGPFFNKSLTGHIDDSREARFEIFGETPEDLSRCKSRLLKFVAGDLDTELNASAHEIEHADLRLLQNRSSSSSVGSAPPANE